MKYKYQQWISLLLCLLLFVGLLPTGTQTEQMHFHSDEITETQNHDHDVLAAEESPVLSLCEDILGGLLGLFALPVSAAYEDGVECEYCGGYRYDDWKCDNGDHCGDGADGDCYNEHHCGSCGECVEDGGLCEDCEFCSECCACEDKCRGCDAVGETVCCDCGEKCSGCDWICGECGKCLECIGDADYCSYCDICVDCADWICYCGDGCNSCALGCESCREVCTNCDPDFLCLSCMTCFDCVGGEGDYCAECQKCKFCVDVVCACGEGCSECAYVCPECGEYCENCADGYICIECGICDDCAGGDNNFCHECLLCKEHVDYICICGEGCSNCSVICKECGEKCENCADDMICNDCGVCFDCVGGEGNYCAECGVCKNCVDICICGNGCVDCAGVCLACFEKCTNCAEEEICGGCGICKDCAGGDGNFCDNCETCKMCSDFICICGSGCSECVERICPECNEKCSECADDELCMECGVCIDCCDAESFCVNCGLCSDCGIVCPCGEGCENCADLCPECEEVCSNCCDTFCASCDLCINCVDELLCEDCLLCGDCTELCEDCGVICHDCAESSCPDCGKCADCMDEYCPDCGICLDCADAMCQDCHYCGDCAAVCDDCQEYCSDCAAFCEECGICEFCQDSSPNCDHDVSDRPMDCKSAGGHKLSEAVITRKPGYTYSGEKQSSCIFCDYVLTEVLPKLTVPQHKYVIVLPMDAVTDQDGEPIRELLSKGTKAVVPALPELTLNAEGRRFTGWVDKKTGKPVQKGDPMTGNIEIVPVWSGNADLSGIQFTDVKVNDYYASAVVWAYENDITAGTSDTTFSPEMTCTRAQVVTFLWRAAGCPEPKSTTNPFRDVKTTDWYYKAVLWAVEQNITQGTSKTTFTPTRDCSTAEILTFLFRSVGAGTNGYYEEAAKWAESQKLIQVTGLNVNPTTPCPRKAIVTFLYGIYG